MISESYRQTQKQMHENPMYGTASVKYAEIVANAVEQYKATRLLDYGAGKCRLFDAVASTGIVRHQFTYVPYEPADDRYSKPPQSADMVACIDVLEHVEPEFLDAVLDDLRRVTAGVGVFTVHCGPAKKTLSDGRNAHLTQEGVRWWVPKLCQRFKVQTLQATTDGFWVLVT